MVHGLAGLSRFLIALSGLPRRRYRLASSLVDRSSCALLLISLYFSFLCTVSPPVHVLSFTTLSFRFTLLLHQVFPPLWSLGFPFCPSPFPELLRLVLFSLLPSRTASAPSFGILPSYRSSIISPASPGRHPSSTSLCIITHRNTTPIRQSLVLQNCCPVAPYTPISYLSSTTTPSGLFGLQYNEPTPYPTFKISLITVPS